HAGGNVVAISLFGASLAARRRGRRLAGFVLSTLGIGVASAAAYLGGHLTFGKGVGVDNTAFDQEPEQWTSVLQADALSEGKPLKATANGAEVVLVRQGESIMAISDTCTHRGCSLAEGDLVDGAIRCPCHG